MFRSIVGFMLGKKILAFLVGSFIFLFIGVPLWLSSEHRKPLLKRERQVCPCCGQVIREGVFRK